MLETMEKDPFMQEVMKAILKVKPETVQLAQLFIFRDDDQGRSAGDAIGKCKLPVGFVHIFN